MATISGKRFQITDGASTPVNLFPYTVTEAVYGLSTVLANTQSAAISAAASSAASLYLPLSGGSSKPMTGAIYVPSNTSALTVVGSSSSILFGVADSQSHFGQTAGTTYLRSGDTNLQHNKAGTNYLIYDASNLTKSVLTTLLESDSGYYVKKSGDTISGSSYVPLTLNSTSTVVGMALQLSGVTKMNVAFSSNTIGAYIQNAAVSGSPYVNIASDGQFKYSNNYVFYHSGNSNKSDVPWECSTLTASSTISTAGSVISTGNIYCGALFDVNRNGNTGALVNTSKMGLEIEAYTNDIRFKAYTLSGSSSTSVGYFLIDSSGNVGIGTTTPVYKFAVVGNEAGSWVSRIAGAKSSVWMGHADGYGIAINSMATTNSQYLLNIRNGQTTLDSGGVDVFRITGSGNVGIGTNLPGEKLDVLGGNIFVSNSGGANLTLSGIARNANNGAILFMDTYPDNGQRNGFKIASVYSATNSRQNLVFYSSNNTTSPYTPSWTAAMTIQYDSNVGIGTNSPGYKLDVSSGSVGDAIRLTSTTTYSCIIYTPSGSGKNWSAGASNDGQFYFYTSSAIRAYFTQAGALVTTGDQVISSDINLKTNLEDVTYSVADIAACRAVTFDWKDGRGHSAGSIAQDWKPLIPELVHGEEGGMTLAYGQIALINSILLAKHETEQDKEIKKLKNRVKELENEVKRLRS